MEWSLWRGSELNLTQCWERLRKKSKDRKYTEEGRGMPKMGAITAKKGQSALLDFLSIRRSPWFDCSYFLEGLVDISLLSYFKSMCRGRKAPFPYHWEFSTLSCTLLGICRGRLVRDNFFFPFLYISITSLQHVLFWFLLFLLSASVCSGWFDLAQVRPQSGVVFVLPSYFFYQYSCTGTSFACRKDCMDRLNKY